MKKLTLLLFLLIISFSSKISGQETYQDLKNKWSASISYSPISTFYYYGGSSEKSHDYYTKGIREVIYPIGINIAINHNLNNRLSFSSGLNIKARLTDISTFALGLSFFIEESTDNRYIFEIPFNVNYNILTHSKIFDPYFKTGLRTTYFKRYYVGEYTQGGLEGTTIEDIDNHDGKLILFYEFGSGTYINIFKSISAKLESNLTYTISGFGYLELQLGMKYSFK
jgi:hypothetical protein